MIINKYQYFDYWKGLCLKVSSIVLLVNNAIAELVNTEKNEIYSSIPRNCPIPTDISGSYLYLYLNSNINDLIVIILQIRQMNAAGGKAVLNKLI